MIAGADARDLRAADQPPCVLSGLRRAGAGPAALRPMQERLAEYARILAPDAEVSCQTI